MSVYLKSASGQVYMFNKKPQYTEMYEEVTREIYVDWCKKNNMPMQEIKI